MRPAASFGRTTSLIVLCACLAPGSRLIAESLPAARDDGPPPLLGLADWKIKSGDDPAWSRPGFDDSEWERVTVAGRFRREGTYWLRKTVDLSVRFFESDPPAISVYNLPTAFELYWDGERLGRNGRWASAREGEIPGRVRFVLILGAGRAEPGTHLLTLRVSNFRTRGNTVVTGIGLGPLGGLTGHIHRLVDRRLVTMGLYFVAALFVIFLFVRQRKNCSFLFFGGYAFLFFLHSLWIYAVEKMGLRLHVFARAEILVIFGIPAAFALLTAFLLWHYEIRRRLIALGVLAGAMLCAGVSGSNPADVQMKLIALPVVFGLGLAAVLAVRRRRGSGWAMAGTGVLAAGHAAPLFSPGLAAFLESLPGFAEMILTALVLSAFIGLISLRLRDENRALETLRRRSRRLEAELLKKSIQPHFLMNTLLSVQSWFGRNPDKAGRMIEALAEEFRIINRIVSEPEIDLSEEIALCRSHLELMGYRRDANYRLVVEGDVAGLKIPPMLFHTLIENGLTHAYEAREDGTFTLACGRKDKVVEFRLENDGSRLALRSETPAGPLEEGLGLKYVRTRLEESYTGRWNLDFGLRGSIWRVRVVIRER